MHPNQMWSTDITDIRLVAIIDWYARRVLVWRLSNTLEAGFCVDCLADALRAHDRPEIVNGVLLCEGIAISMNGRGRALDNLFVERLWRRVNYEDVYIKGYANLPERLLGLTESFDFYTGERPSTPEVVYRLGEGGGAKPLRLKWIVQLKFEEKLSWTRSPL